MPEEVFALMASTPDGSFAHGRARLTGGARAGAELRRGFDLSAEVQLEGQLTGTIGDQLVGSLEASGEIGGGVVMQAQLPLDLFDPMGAGLVARFRAQAAAAVSVAANVGLTLDELQALVRSRLGGPLETLVDLFLAEVEIRAGVWARAAFAAEVYGEVLAVGGLLPSSSGGAGFSALVRYGAGLGAGAGWEFVTNVGIRDPAALVERLADACADELSRVGDGFIESLEGDDRAAAEAALVAARVVLAAGTRGLFRFGTALTSAAAGTAGEAGRPIAQAFVAEAQKVLLGVLVDVGFGLLSRLMGESRFAVALWDSGAEWRANLAGLLTTMRREVARLEGTSPAAVDTWSSAMTRLVAGFDLIVSSATSEEDWGRDLRRALALVWAAGILVQRVVTVDRIDGQQPVFGPTAVPTRAASGPSEFIAGELGKDPQAPLSLADLVAFVVGADPLADVAATLPGAGRLVDWLSQATGRPAGELVSALLVGLAQADDDALGALLAQLASVLAPTVHDVVIPQLLEPLATLDNQDPAARTVLNEIVAPLLIVLPDVVLPNLAQATTAPGARRLRDAASAALFQLVAQQLVALIDTVLRHGLMHSSQALHDLAQTVRAFGEQSPALALVASAGAKAVVPVSPTPSDVAALFELAADVVALVEAARPQTSEAVRRLLSLGAGPTVTRERLQGLATTDQAPDPDALEDLLRLAADRAWRVAALVVPRGLEILAMHFLHQIELVVRALEQGAKAIVEAAVAAATWLADQVEEIQRRLGELAQRIAQLTADIARSIAELATHLRGLVGQAVNRIRDAGWSLVAPLVADLPDEIEGALRDLYNALFDAVRWLVEAPFAVLASVAGWVRQFLDSRLGMASLDEAEAHEEVRRRIRASLAADVHFDLALKWGDVTIVDLGRITIPAGTIAGAVVDVVMGDDVYRDRVHGMATAALSIQAAGAEQQTLQERRDGALSDQTAIEEAQRLAPGDPLRVRFLSPAEGDVVLAPARVQVAIDGANRTFVASTLGVPRRISLRVNGIEYELAADHVEEVTEGLRLTLGLLIPPSPLRGVAGRAVVEPPIVMSRPSGFDVLPNEERVLVVDSSLSADTGAPFARQLGASGWPEESAPSREAPEPSPSPAQPPLAIELSPPRGARLRENVLSSIAEPSAKPLDAIGTVRVDGPLDPARLAPPEAPVQPLSIDTQGQPVVAARDGFNVIQVAVADGQGRQATAKLMVFIRPPLRVRAEPAVVPLDTEVELTVRATTAAGDEVPEGVVRLEGVEIGPLSLPFPFTFHEHEVERTPSWPSVPWAAPPQTPPVTRPPLVTVSISGYPVQAVPLSFVSAGTGDTGAALAREARELRGPLAATLGRPDVPGGLTETLRARLQTLEARGNAIGGT